MMEVSEVIIKRVSIREYKPTDVPDDKLMRVLEAGRMAPTGGNRQEMKFVVIKNKETKGKLGEASGGQKHVAGAPFVIAAVATHPERMMVCDVPAYPVDVSIALAHMMLAAADIGLGTCWIGAFQQEMVKNILDIPKQCRVVALLSLGYPAAGGREKIRKPIEELVCYEKYTV
jgi:nitroreductase